MEVPKQLRPYLFKKGNKAAAGKHKKSMKTYAKEYLLKLPEDERIEFLNSLNPEVIWRMAEGNPSNEVTGKDGKDLFPDQRAKNLAQEAIDNFLNGKDSSTNT